MKLIDKSELFVALVYKNFKKYSGVSHIGLGISAINNAKMLNDMGIRAQVFPIDKPEDISLTLWDLEPKPTHVIVQALWVPPPIMGFLCNEFPQTQFCSVCHSNVGFLQAEPAAITMFREYLNLERETINFHAGGNSQRFCTSIEGAFTEPCTYLPNMYWLHHKHGEPKRMWSDIGGPLRIGIFGASRFYKNILSAVMASIEMASNTGAQTQIFINCGRDDGGSQRANSVRQAAKNLVAGLPNVTLSELGWASWTQFIKFVGSMNLLMQPSYSESFNIVTADGCAEGVPSVVSEAITWAPKSWVADCDDASDIARVGMQLLGDPMAASVGFQALKTHNKLSQAAWLSYLTQNSFGIGKL